MIIFILSLFLINSSAYATYTNLNNPHLDFADIIKLKHTKDSDLVKSHVADLQSYGLITEADLTTFTALVKRLVKAALTIIAQTTPSQKLITSFEKIQEEYYSKLEESFNKNKKPLYTQATPLCDVDLDDDEVPREIDEFYDFLKQYKLDLFSVHAE
jgi:hypothetical protein